MAYNIEYKKNEFEEKICQVCLCRCIEKDESYISLYTDDEFDNCFCLEHVYEIVKNPDTNTCENEGRKIANNIKLGGIPMCDIKYREESDYEIYCFVCEEEIVDDFLNIFLSNRLHVDCFGEFREEVKTVIENNKEKIISDNL